MTATSATDGTLVRAPRANPAAIATRMRPDRDLIIVPGARADRSEPLESGGTVTKLAIDATRRDGDRTDWVMARPPEWAINRAREMLRANIAPLQPIEASFKSL